MKVKILQENLLKNLLRVGRIVSSKPQLPILQNILIKTEGTLLRIVSSNMETTVTSIVPAKVESEGGFCVPAKLFSELISSLPEESLEISEKEGTAEIRTSKTHATLPTMQSSEFPPVTLLEDKGGEKLELDLIKTALAKVLFAAATDEGRPLLTGVKMLQEKDSLLFVATDGYRLSLKRIDKNISKDLDMVVPARTLSEVYKIAGEEKEEKNLVIQKLSEGQLGFGVGDTQVITRLIDGEYPAFSKIIPTTHTTAAILDTQEFLRAVKSVSIFARDSANIIRLSVSKNGLEASANTPQVGKNIVDIDADVEGEGGEIAFNSRFLLELLNNTSDERLSFEMTGSLNPGVFKVPEDQTFLHIIMPVRVQS